MTMKQIDRLISDFKQAAKKHHSVTMSGNSRQVNRQAKRIHRTFLRIVKIGESARKELLAQIDNEDDAVALMAATYSLKYDPEKSKAKLRQLARDNKGIIGFEAEQAIQRWEEGMWQLE